MNISRYMRSFAIAAMPLFLIAGAAFAASGHVALVSDPTSGPTAGSTEAAGSFGSPVIERSPEGTKESEASESPEATKAPGATESAEPSKAPEANESAEPKTSMDSDSSKEKDGDAAPGASAGTHQGDSDGNGSGGNVDGGGHAKVGQPGPSGAPALGGGDH